MNTLGTPTIIGTRVCASCIALVLNHIPGYMLNIPIYLCLLNIYHYHIMDMFDFNKGGGGGGGAIFLN